MEKPGFSRIFIPPVIIIRIAFRIMTYFGTYHVIENVGFLGNNMSILQSFSGKDLIVYYHLLNIGVVYTNKNKILNV